MMLILESSVNPLNIRIPMPEQSPDPDEMSHQASMSALSKIKHYHMMSRLGVK